MSSRKICAYYSILNDRISYTQVDSINQWKKKLGKHINNNKRGYRSMPALKLGRLGVCDSYKNRGIGTAILDFLKIYALNQNEKCGCKFLTVDAYGASIDFYLKNDFEFMTTKDGAAPTRQMYFDLARFLSIILAISNLGITLNSF